MSTTPQAFYIRHSFCIFISLCAFFLKNYSRVTKKQKYTHLFLRLINFWCPKAIFMVQKMKMKIFCPSLCLWWDLCPITIEFITISFFIIQKSPFHTTAQKHPKQFSFHKYFHVEFFFLIFLLSVVLQIFVCL